MTCVLPFSGDPDSLCAYEITGYIPPYMSCTADKVALDPATCTYGCGSPPPSGCTPPPPAEPGYVSQYLDSVTVNDGAGGEYVAISGYSPGWLDSSNALHPYGDLVYAQYTPGGDEVVSWTILDGKPADGPNNIFFNPTGWRNGNTEPGDDVGKYSSITASAAGDVYIAYVDVTPGSQKLKLAYRAAGSTTFAISVIDDSPLVTTGSAFYPSITLLNGNPVVAYGVRQVAGGPGQQPLAWVRVATATTTAPAGVSDWGTPVDLTDSTANAGCVEGDGLCASGDRCVVAGTSGRGYCITPTNDCTMACNGMFGSQATCYNTVCADVKTGADLVDTTGLFNNLVPDATAGGLALVYHDRSAGYVRAANVCETNAQCNPTEFCSGATPDVPNDNDGDCMIPNGNLWGVRFNGTAWSNRFLIDGYSRKVATVGDSGQHVSLAVTSAGVWHLAYLDGTFDRIRYVSVAAGATTTPAAGAFQIIDDGTAGAGRPADRADGRKRLVGGEIAIALSPGGELRVLYQDLTGPTNADPTMTPPGTQAILAHRALAAATWGVDYAATAAPNSGYWATQTLGILPATTGASYCVWAERAANTNDPNGAPVPDGAATHVRVCDTD